MSADISYEDFMAPNAVDAAAQAVFEIMDRDQSCDVHLVVHDVLHEEISLSEVTFSQAQLVALREAVFARYQTLRVESGELDEVDDEDDEG